METKARGSFTGSIGFILAAAGSAIGLGNLWRFPYLAAKDGGGLFIVIYIIFALTFGFALMSTEIAIGRKTGLSPLQAYGQLDRRFGFLGWIATLVPVIIFPYYCVIGGWVTKYAATYIEGAHTIYEAGTGEFFTSFISADFAPIFWLLVFMLLSAVVVVFGVEKGIEKASKVLMPALFVLIIAIAVYSLTLSYTDPATGQIRTALDGLKIYLIPNFEGITASKFITVLLDAAGQMFYSMSLAMGIMITYGSYCRKDSSLITSVNRIEFFDTGVALLAGLIIVPTVFVFQGMEGLTKAGPSLMFVSLPTVFEQMGAVGTVVGALFFVLVLFAALTSSISLMETIAASLIDRFKIGRPVATLITFILSLVIGVVVCLGYNVWYMDIGLPNGTVGQILDVLDYISNSLMLPAVALLTCLLVGWFCKPKGIIDEIKLGMDSKGFRREKLYVVMIRFVAPALLFIILLQAFNAFAFLE